MSGCGRSWSPEEKVLVYLPLQVLGRPVQYREWVDGGRQEALTFSATTGLLQAIGYSGKLEMHLQENQD